MPRTRVVSPSPRGTPCWVTQPASHVPNQLPSELSDWYRVLAYRQQFNQGAIMSFCVGYKGGEIYWLAIHSNQATALSEAYGTAATSKTRQAPLF
jgi:hypothetical protein